MPTPILKGTKTPLQQFWEMGFSPTQGASFNTEYKGIDITQMGALAQSLANRGYSGKLKFEKSLATLTASCTSTSGGVPGFTSPVNDIVDKWEVGVDSEKPELFENSNFINIFYNADNGYGVPVSQQIFAKVKSVSGSSGATWLDLVHELQNTHTVDASGNNVSDGSMLWESITSSITGGIGPTNLLQFKYFVDDYFRGRTNFVHGKYLLRHTTSAPNTYADNVADFNVEKIYSIAQLLSECQNGSLWIFPLPGYLAYKILSYPVPIAMPPNYVWGALKMRSGAVTAARNRIEITTEYLIDACPKHTYGLIS